MNKMLIVLAFPLACLAQDLVGPVLGVLATDLSNANRSAFVVKLATGDSQVRSDFASREGHDMCADRKFAQASGDFVCRRGVTYVVSDTAYDAVVSDAPVYVEGKVLVACTGDSAGCDVRIRSGRVLVDFESLGSKGFVPDPVNSALKH